MLDWLRSSFCVAAILSDRQCSMPMRHVRGPPMGMFGDPYYPLWALHNGVSKLAGEV